MRTPTRTAAKDGSEIDVSVIIVSWNVRELLARCLNALSSPEVSGDLKIEVIVVDNASSDGSEEAARRFEGVSVIQSGANLGYGRGNNLGLAAARGRTFLVLNPDTVPEAGSITALVEFADRHPRAGIVAPRLLNVDGSIQASAFRFPSLEMALIDLFPFPDLIPGRIQQWLHTSRLNGRYPRERTASRPFRIGHPLGACMLIKRRAFEQVGGFDPSFHMYAEEIDLGIRYASVGWETWQVPSARVVHLGGQSTRQIPDRMFVELWRSRLHLYRLHYPRSQEVLLRVVLAVAQVRDTLAALAGLRRGLVSREEARRRWRQAGQVLRMAVKWSGQT